MQNVTAWYVFEEQPNAYVFNHLENGHTTNTKPTAKFPSQSWWPSKQWRHEHGYLDENNVFHYI